MDDGIWLSITEYQNLKGLSVSTIRRYIKACRVKWKVENKKYFIYMSVEKYTTLKSESVLDESSNLEDKLEIERLKIKIKTLEDERNDLKMLVDLYEGNKDDSLPELPELPIG